MEYRVFQTLHFTLFSTVKKYIINFDFQHFKSKYSGNWQNSAKVIKLDNPPPQKLFKKDGQIYKSSPIQTFKR